MQARLPQNIFLAKAQLFIEASSCGNVRSRISGFSVSRSEVAEVNVLANRIENLSALPVSLALCPAGEQEICPSLTDHCEAYTAWSREILYYLTRRIGISQHVKLGTFFI